MKLTKKEIIKMIKKELLAEGGVEDIVWFSGNTLTVKVPSFTFKTKVKVSDRENWDSRTIKQPVGVDFESFGNDIEKILDRVIAKATVDAFNRQLSKKTKFQLTDKGVNIGGHADFFPKYFSFNKK